jgi:hypothetical protein
MKIINAGIGIQNDVPKQLYIDFGNMEELLT